MYVVVYLSIDQDPCELEAAVHVVGNFTSHNTREKARTCKVQLFRVQRDGSPMVHKLRDCLSSRVRLMSRAEVVDSATFAENT
jgi:hypothetical protein